MAFQFFLNIADTTVDLIDIRLGRCAEVLDRADFTFDLGQV